jgi:ADP-heptose:LPS heptosyltransferase
MKTLTHPGDEPIEVIAVGKQLPAFDWHCPIVSLPLAFKTTLDSIPADIPYLAADVSLCQARAAQLGPKLRPRVGIAWSGNPDFNLDHYRSLKLDTLKPLFDADCEFHCMQKDVQEFDLPLASGIGNLIMHSESFTDFAETAALMAQMDLIITSDTSVAHLAGALGCPTWLLCSWNPDFRWMLERSDSPWYPGMRLFRQSGLDDWSSAIEQVAAELGTWISHQ